jgi:hypothetical protein
MAVFCGAPVFKANVPVATVLLYFLIFTNERSKGNEASGANNNYIMVYLSRTPSHLLLSFPKIYRTVA